MATRGTGAIFFGMLAFACTGLGGPPCPRGAIPLAVAERTKPADAPPSVGERYFPNRSLEWPHDVTHAAELRFYRELPLAERSRSHVYRMLSTPSLGKGRAGVITVEADGDGAGLTSTQPVACEGEQGEGLVLFVERRSLDSSEWTQITRCMDAAFWPVPTDDGVQGADGTTHLVEGARAGRYHAVTRWGLGSGLHESADRRAIHACIVKLEQLAGWRQE